jgi:ribosomal protein S2
MECSRSGTPAIGVSDTNAQSGFSNIATPGNDDSINSLIFFNTHISKYILCSKFKHVIS